MTTALHRLYIGLPVYAIWYVLAWRWLSGYFVPWIAGAICFLMPFAGLWALDYCRRARDTDHTNAFGGRPPCGNRAHATRGRIEQHPVAGPRRIGTVQQVPGCQAFQQAGCS